MNAITYGEHTAGGWKRRTKKDVDDDGGDDDDCGGNDEDDDDDDHSDSDGKNVDDYDGRLMMIWRRWWKGGRLSE